LAGPIVVTQLAQMAIGTTDILMLGAFSKDALAAAGLGLSLFVTIWFVGMGPALAVSPVIAHILGATPGDRDGVRASVRMSMWAVLALSPVLMLCLHASRDVLLALGEPPDLAEPAGAFIRVLSLGLPFALAFNVLRGFATAVNRPMAPLIVMGLTIAINALLDYVLIFGHFGAPRLGLMGSAIASASWPPWLPIRSP
jgi:MATE family multidrug resistance protein